MTRRVHHHHQDDVESIEQGKHLLAQEDESKEERQQQQIKTNNNNNEQQQQQQQQHKRLRQQQQYQRKNKGGLYNPYEDPRFHTLWKKLGYILLLLFAMWLVVQQNQTMTYPENYDDNDNEGEEQQQRQTTTRFTVWNALQSHKPSWRIFRALVEVNLTIVMAAFSIFIWRTYIGIDMTEQLLFQPVHEQWSGMMMGRTTTTHRTTTAYNDEDEDSDNSDDDDDDDELFDDDTISEFIVFETESEREQMTQEISDTLDFAQKKMQAGMEEGGKQQQPQAPSSSGGESGGGISVGTAGSMDTVPFDELQDTTAAENSITTTTKTAEQLKEEEEAQTRKKRKQPKKSSLTTTTTSNVPLPRDILSFALDMFLLILIALFGYTLVASGYLLTNENEPGKFTKYIRLISKIAAPTFPLLLFIYLAFKTVVPWNHTRSELWTVVYLTIMAPMVPVTFRDGFIGDILTSTVRPLQDISFTICYILFGMKSYWSDYYYFQQQQAQQPAPHHHHHEEITAATTTFFEKADASVPAMERSWLLHTVLLPACMVSPLVWRFLQNMRQVYDQRQRWPFLGNALKYFVAAQVAMVGVYQPQYQQTWLWLASFVVATLYQVWWDIFMDWELLTVVVVPKKKKKKKEEGQFGRFPFSLQLRNVRLYPNTGVYWFLCGLNMVLRFCWTLSFLPATYLDRTGVLIVNTLVNNENYLGALLASAEIVRRSLWGLLRVEWETIKVRQQIAGQTQGGGGGSQNGQQQQPLPKDDDVIELVQLEDMKPMRIPGDRTFDLRQRLQLKFFTTDMSTMDDIQVLMELSLYTSIFAVLAFIWAYHRGTF